MKGFAQTVKWRPVGVKGGPEQPRAPLPSRAPAGFCSHGAAKPGMMPAHAQGHAWQAPPCRRPHFTRPSREAGAVLVPTVQVCKPRLREG